MTWNEPVTHRPMKNDTTSGTATEVSVCRAKPQPISATTPNASWNRITWIRTFSMGKIVMSTPRLRSMGIPIFFATRRKLQSRMKPLLTAEIVVPTPIGR